MAKEKEETVVVVVVVVKEESPPPYRGNETNHDKAKDNAK